MRTGVWYDCECPNTYALPLQTCTCVSFWWKVRNQTAVETTRDVWYEAYASGFLFTSFTTYMNNYATAWVTSVSLCVCVDDYFWLSGGMIDLSISLHNLFPSTLGPKPSHLSTFNHYHDSVPFSHNGSEKYHFIAVPKISELLRRKGTVHLTFTWWCSRNVTPFVVRDIGSGGLSGSHSINFHLAILVLVNDRCVPQA